MTAAEYVKPVAASAHRKDKEAPVANSTTETNLNVALAHAIAEVGRIVEAMEPHERSARVQEFLAKEGFLPQDSGAITFLLGVFINAHEARMTWTTLADRQAALHTDEVQAIRDRVTSADPSDAAALPGVLADAQRLLVLLDPDAS